MLTENEVEITDVQLKRILTVVNIFKMERIVYVTLTIISALSILGIGLYLAIAKENITAFLTLLVPTGTLTMCIFRILKMWDDVLKFLIGGTQNG